MRKIDIRTADLYLPGHYRVEVLRVFVGKNIDGKSYFVVETLVLKSDNPKISIGDEREWIFLPDSGLKRIRAFVGTAHGFGPKANSVSTDMIDHALHWTGPLENAQLDLHCYYNKPGSKTLSHDWSPLKTAKVGQLPRRKKNSWISKSQRSCS